MGHLPLPPRASDLVDAGNSDIKQRSFWSCSICGTGLGTGFLHQYCLNGEETPVRVPGTPNRTASHVFVSGAWNGPRSRPDPRVEDSHVSRTVSVSHFSRDFARSDRKLVSLLAVIEIPTRASREPRPWRFCVPSWRQGKTLFERIGIFCHKHPCIIPITGHTHSFEHIPDSCDWWSYGGKVFTQVQLRWIWPSCFGNRSDWLPVVKMFPKLANQCSTPLWTGDNDITLPRPSRYETRLCSEFCEAKTSQPETRSRGFAVLCRPGIFLKSVHRSGCDGLLCKGFWIFIHSCRRKLFPSEITKHNRGVTAVLGTHAGVTFWRYNRSALFLVVCFSLWFWWWTLRQSETILGQNVGERRYLLVIFWLAENGR